MSEPTIDKIVIHYSDGSTKTVSTDDYSLLKKQENSSTNVFHQIWDSKDYWA